MAYNVNQVPVVRGRPPPLEFAGLTATFDPLPALY
jgi:hypothetical protein